MPRKGHIANRDVLADPLYNDKIVTKLVNNVMIDGKKGVLGTDYTISWDFGSAPACNAQNEDAMNE